VILSILSRRTNTFGDNSIGILILRLIEFFDQKIPPRDAGHHLSDASIADAIVHQLSNVSVSAERPFQERLSAGPMAKHGFEIGMSFVYQTQNTSRGLMSHAEGGAAFARRWVPRNDFLLGKKRIGGSWCKIRIFGLSLMASVRGVDIESAAAVARCPFQSRRAASAGQER
jgi:hypothetical protein